MFKLIALLAVIACTSAQVLRVNPLTLGTAHLADPLTYNLAHRGLAAPYGLGAIGAYGAYGVPAIARGIAPAVVQKQVIAPAPILARHALGYGLAGLEGPPQPYTFGYNSQDEFGTHMGRQETADGSGAVQGSYSLAEADGRQRVVQYVADAGGFRASVQTNEPGTANANPADVVIQSAAPHRR